MMFAPHILQVKIVPSPAFDADMNPIPGQAEWKEIGPCRCDDNGATKQISVNGVVRDYNYHIVYEGDRIEAGTKVRVIEESGDIRAEGEVIKPKRCNYFSYSEIWL